jgi:DNA-3-methyladenine glycosylase II
MDSFTFSIAPVAPFRLDVTTWVLRRRAENMMDRWDGCTYRRAVLISGSPVEFAVTERGSVDCPHLSVRVSGKRLPQNVQQLAAATLDRMLGLSCALDEFYHATAGDSVIGPLARKFRGLKPTMFPSVFEALVNALACQQLTLTFGIRLLNRLTESCGHPLETGDPSPRTFPKPEDLLALGSERLRAMQFSQAKSRALLELCAGMVEGAIDLDTLAPLDDAAVVARLTELRSVGRWSAEYVLLRGLGRLEIFPCDDVGARNNLGRLLGLKEKLNYETAHRIVDRWKPFAGLVYFHLLVEGLVSRDPSLLPIGDAHEAASTGTAGPRESCRE